MKQLQAGQLLRRRKLAAAIFALVTVFGSLDVGAATLAEMSPEERALLVAEMNASANEVGSKGLFYFEDPLPVTVSVSLDVDANYVVVDMDERIGPRTEQAATEDLLGAISSSIMEREPRVDAAGVRFLFGGKPSTFWFPEPERDEPPEEDRLVEPAQARSASVVVISPGHGMYFHHGFKDWRFQRNTVNGILEDDITPMMATQLASALQPDGVTVHNLRPEHNVLAHGPSREPWWRLGVRYLLEAKLPDHPEIWHAFPNSTASDRERDEDLRSRPLYANFLGADAFLHVHTNAHETKVPRGTRAIIHERAPDRRLAVNILCSMSELIHTKKEFESFPVPSQPSPRDDIGENKHAKMPSVIVEVGFHTNPEDALLLRNREFQGLAMRGVAKGYRLFREGKPCGEFSIEPLAPASGRVGYDVHLPVALLGNPVFPVRMTSRDLNCSGRYCHSRSASLYSQAEVDKHRIQYLCTRNDLGRRPVELSVEARDFDGVLAKAATYKVVCGR
jgi:N-acetylmuramoyl-L-alanine amidase